MEPIQLTTQQAILYVAILNAAIGAVLGLAPLILGFIKKNVRLGVFGFLVCVIGGALLGVILSVPGAAVFSWLIIRRGRREPVTDAVPPSDPDLASHS
jgi:hypothetical protein